MRKLLIIAAWTLLLPAISNVRAQETPQEISPEPDAEWTIRELTEDSEVSFDFTTKLAHGTGGVIVQYGSAVLTADKVTLDQESGLVQAEGSVRILRDEFTWTGDKVSYNFKTRQMTAEIFRAGAWPVFIQGEGLRGDEIVKSTSAATNVYYATNVFVTADDYAHPAYRVKAKRITIVPGQYVVATHAILYLGPVPSFYFPYFRRTLDERANHFSFTPGYRTRFGPYLLGSYYWFLGSELDGELHADYRYKRGFAGGPDVNFHLGQWGDGSLKYYYTRDNNPPVGFDGAPVDQQRQRIDFTYLAPLTSNLTARAAVRWWSDEYVTRDFFEGEYRANVQPATFLELSQLWRNWSLNAYGQPRLNDFFETVERLPDIKLTGMRQQLGPTPVFYESESSLGYYRRRFAETNMAFSDFRAWRGDTFHQVLLPHTFFGWLNVTPRVGGRYTYYGEAEGGGATTSEEDRMVFNTGMEVSLKASRVWEETRNKLLDMDGARHIIEPYINYAFVPNPTTGTNKLPQFDYEIPSLRLLPIDFPDYNAIDSIDSRNVVRLGLRNKVQTKRDGQVDDLVHWMLFTDYRIERDGGQDAFSDLFSDIDFKPRSWILLTSETRTDLNQGQLNLADHRLTLTPNDVWSVSLGHRHLRDGFLGLDGYDLLTSTLYYRLNENWGFRTSHQFEARDGTLQEQYYTIYRDLRSWTAALTLRVRDTRQEGEDITAALTFSLKAFPRFKQGDDQLRPSLLLGG